MRYLWLAAMVLTGCGEDNSELGQSFLLGVQAETAVRASLKDPASAEFSALRFDVQNRVVCGTVNARNALGGFSGPQDFIVKAGKVTLTEGLSAEDAGLATIDCIGALPQDRLSRD